MMLKKIKSLFIIEEEATSPESKTGVDTTSESTKSMVSASKSFQISTGSAEKGTIDDKFLSVLFEALESSNQEGFDYMEYKDFLRSLANVPMDDSTRYKSAYATAQTMGATKEKIISSAQHYLNILAKEQAKFQQALSGQKEKNLVSKQDEIKQLEQVIQTKTADIEKLKADLETHRKEIGSLEEEINSASEKLTQTANDFEATYQTLLGQIQLDINNIESHL
jgi:hypothetical protein